MAKKLWNKDFILLLQGKAVSTVGDLMYSVAIGYWVYQQTGSSGLMGLMSSISMFITMFFSPFCGSIVDKCNRKWLIVSIDTVQGILMLTVGILAYRNALNVPVVLLVALLAAFGSVFYSPAIDTILLDIVPRDDLVRGQSVNGSINTAISFVGTAFSGAMVAFLGVPLIVVLNGLSNLYSAATELFIHVPKTLQQGMEVSVRTVLRDSGNAIRSILSNRFLRLFVPFLLILNLLCSGPLTLILPFCLEKGFGVDSYGYLIATYTMAQLLCVVLLGTFKLKPKFRYAALSLGYSCCVPFYILAYLSDRFGAVCVFAFIAAFLNCAGNTVFNASLMLALPEENRSAILGFIQSAGVGGSALSAVIYGLLGEVFPLALTFIAGNVISFIPMLYLCFHPSTREFVLEHCE